MIKLNRLQKIVSKVGVLLLTFLLMVQIGATNAHYFDGEETNENKHETGALDLVLTSDGPFTPEFAEPDTPSTMSANFANAGSLPFDYDQGYVDDGSQPVLCSDLDLEVTHGLSVVYSGKLVDFTYTHSETLVSGDADDFSYEISLPAGAGFEYIGLGCEFDIASYAWQPEIGIPEVGFWDVENLEFETSVGDWRICTNIHGVKRDDQEQGLEGFEIVVHPTEADPVETLLIDSSNPTPVTSTTTMDAGKKYLIEVSGVWQDDTRKVDASYFSDDDWQSRGDFDTDGGRDNKQLDLLVNEQDVNWGTYSSDHLYKFIMEGDDSQANFVIYDADQDGNPPEWYGNNSGSLTVKIFDVSGEIYTTNESGEYNADVCGEYFQVLEVPQSGWKQISPSEPDYYHVDLNVYDDESLDFANRRLEQKIVINEVYYDVDTASKGTENKNEWIELYNPNPYPISLKKWKLVDAVGTEKVINPEISIPAGGFAVLSHDNTTWNTYWTVPEGAVTILLTGSRAWLNNDGDTLKLYNSDGNEVDFVAWEGGAEGWDGLNLEATDGKSIARIIKGVDTDLPADWHVLNVPNPGTNPHNADGSLVEQLDLGQEAINEIVDTSGIVDCLENCEGSGEAEGVVDQQEGTEVPTEESEGVGESETGSEPATEEAILPEEVTEPEPTGAEPIDET
ncbi:lamin tail domain-containing protein [Patescibacteria group bacterium]